MVNGEGRTLVKICLNLTKEGHKVWHRNSVGHRNYFHDLFDVSQVFRINL